MPNYWYIETNKKKQTRLRSVIYDLNQGEDITLAIFQRKLAAKREHRFHKLFEGYNGDMEDVIAIHEYLPSEFKSFASNHAALKEQLASIYEIRNNYEISNIEIAPDCYGCIHDRPGQRDHMECPTGCLHTPELCFTCN